MSKKLIDAEEAIRNIIIAGPREPDEAIRATASAINVIQNMPEAQPECGEMLVICDKCGHVIHVKRG